MRKDSGTYALILRSVSREAVQVGRWGCLDLVPGYYVYVGSAFGPGGVLARVSRHLREEKPRRWHIDYLSGLARTEAVWYSHEPVRLEHRWARALGNLSGMIGIAGLGCSDCDCRAHLFASAWEPDHTSFRRAVGGTLETWQPGTRLRPGPSPGPGPGPGPADPAV